jgi:Fe-S-cluster-containing hydrogenase component 2
MHTDRVKLFFEDLTLNSSYEIFEEGKEDESIKELAKKRGLKIPSKDLALFKCKYAFVDKENKNGCILPKDEVIKALDTLNGKAVDKDHFRKTTIGFWLGAELLGSTIIAYGAFWKSNFPEDYEEIKRRMAEGHVKISFEAWGTREYVDGKIYNLKDCEFCGGALLFDTNPAFPNAEIMEFSQKNRVLEFAKVIEEGETMDEITLAELEAIEGAIPVQVLTRVKELIKTGMPMKEAMKQAWQEFKKNKGEVEESKLNFLGDEQLIARVCADAECPLCKSKSYKDVQNIDFVNSKITHKCGTCGTVCTTDMTPTTEIKKRGKKPKNYQMTQTQGSIDDIINSTKTDEEVEIALIELIEGKELIDEDMSIMEEAKKLSYQERKNIKDDLFAVVVTVKNKITGKPRKIRMFPIADPAHVRNALARLPQAVQTLNKLGISVDTVKNKIMKRARELNMTDLLKRHTKGGTGLMDELLKKYSKASVEELATFLDSELETVKASLTVKDAEVAQFKSEAETAKLALKAKEDAEKASLITARKAELGESAKDVSDEDLLNDVKFENLKLKKELATLKDKKPVKGGLESGAAGAGDENSFKKQKSIQEQAFGKTDKE